MGSFLFGLYTTIYIKHNNEFEILINMVSSLSIILTGIFPTYSPEEDIYDQLDKFKNITKKYDYFLQSKSELKDESLYLNLFLNDLKLNLNLNDNQLDDILIYQDEIKTYDRYSKNKGNLKIVKLLKKYKEENNTHYIFLQEYNGKKTKWIFGYNSRLYHNLGVICFVFGNVLLDIYKIGFYDRNTTWYFGALFLFGISMIIKSELTMIFEAFMIGGVALLQIKKYYSICFFFFFL